MNRHQAIAAAKKEAEQIPPERREKLAADFDAATHAAQAHSEFRRR